MSVNHKRRRCLCTEPGMAIGSWNRVCVFPPCMRHSAAKPAGMHSPAFPSPFSFKNPIKIH